MSKNKTRTKDKYRVVYNDTQRIELENEFRSSEYISIPRKHDIAQKLQLSERQIKIWFQNRRAKKRKQEKRRSAVGVGPESATATVVTTTTTATIKRETTTSATRFQQQQQQQHSYHHHQVNPNSWYPAEPAIVSPKGHHQHYNGTNASVAVASPNLEPVIGAPNSTAGSPVALRPDVVPNQQQQQQPVNQTNNYYQPGNYQEPMYQCQQDYYNHRSIEPFQHHHPHPPPSNAAHGWTPNGPTPTDQPTSPQLVANVNQLNITHNLMEQATSSSSPYSTGASINQLHPSSATTSYTNGYGQQQHYQHQDNVYQIQQQNNSNHNAIIQPPLQHNQKDIYASSYHILSTIN